MAYGQRTCIISQRDAGLFMGVVRKNQNINRSKIVTVSDQWLHLWLKNRGGTPIFTFISLLRLRDELLTASTKAAYLAICLQPPAKEEASFAKSDGLLEIVHGWKGTKQSEADWEVWDITEG